MATSLKISELQRSTAADIDLSDLFLLTDISSDASKAVTYGALESALMSQINGVVNNLVALTGSGTGAVGIGDIDGDVVGDGVTLKAAIQQLATAIESLQSSLESTKQTLQNNIDALPYLEPGNSVHALKANSTADAEPDEYMYLVVDKADGSIKAVDIQHFELG